MKPELILKANELYQEVTKLKKYKDLLNDGRHGKAAHFEFVQHYGSLENYERVDIDKRHTKRFSGLLDAIISELEKEIEEL